MRLVRLFLYALGAAFALAAFHPLPSLKGFLYLGIALALAFLARSLAKTFPPKTFEERHGPEFTLRNVEAWEKLGKRQN